MNGRKDLSERATEGSGKRSEPSDPAGEMGAIFQTFNIPFWGDHLSNFEFRANPQELALPAHLS